MNSNKRRVVREINKISIRISKLKNQISPLPIRTNRNENKKRLSKKLHDEVVMPIESWTLHGLPNVVRSKYRSMKIIWAIIFLASVGISIYFVYNTIKEYLQFNVTTLVRSIDVDELEYPVITFCNSNQISNQNGLDYLLSILNQTGLIDVDLDGFTNYIESTQYNHFNDIQQNLGSVLFYPIPIEQRENYTATIDETFIGGSLNEQNITVDDFNWIFSEYLGNCYQLNTDSKLKVNTYQENILKLYFNFTLPPFVSKYGKKNAIDVFVSDKKTNPYNIFFDTAINIQTGLDTGFKLRKSVYNKQKKPYSDCDFIEDDDGNFEYPSSSFDRKYYDQINQAGYVYSQSLCISFCQIDKIGRNCTFRANSINVPNNMDNFCPNRNLNFIDNYALIEAMLYNYYFNQKIDRECAKHCPLECKTVKYDVYPAYSKIIINELNTTSDNLLNFYLVYNSISYLNYEESPSISVYNLVSNIGGAIGLLLGIFGSYLK